MNRFQLSLRTLLMMTLAACCVAWWIGTPAPFPGGWDIYPRIGPVSVITLRCGEHPLLNVPYAQLCVSTNESSYQGCSWTTLEAYESALVCRHTWCDQILTMTLRWPVALCCLLELIVLGLIAIQLGRNFIARNRRKSSNTAYGFVDVSPYFTSPLWVLPVRGVLARGSRPSRAVST